MKEILENENDGGTSSSDTMLNSVYLIIMSCFIHTSCNNINNIDNPIGNNESLE